MRKKKLTKSRRLCKGEVDLYVGNGTKAVTLTVETYYLTFQIGIILELDNCYFVSILSRNIVSVSFLALNGLKFIMNGKCCSFYNDNVYYGYGIYMNSLYILDLDINNKKNKLDNQYLSHL
jgi:hypothetical protein